MKLLWQFVAHMVGLVSLVELGRCNDKCLPGMAWVSIQKHNSNTSVCHMNHHGLILYEILEGAPLFFCDIISQWLGLLDTGSNSSPEVLYSLCISCSDFWWNLGEYHMTEMLDGVPTSLTVLRERPPQRCCGCWRKLDNLVLSVNKPQFSLRNIDSFHSGKSLKLFC